MIWGLYTDTSSKALSENIFCNRLIINMLTPNICGFWPVLTPSKNQNFFINIYKKLTGCKKVVQKFWFKNQIQIQSKQPTKNPNPIFQIYINCCTTYIKILILILKRSNEVK